MSTTTAEAAPQSDAEAPEEAVEATPEVPANDSPSVAEMDREELFKWNTWVHVGDGAETCPLTAATEQPDYRIGLEIPACTDSGHFHAWLRLPNPLQRRDLVDKARAGRARKSRELRDPQSDAAIIIEDELEAIRAVGDTETLISEVIERHFQEDLAEATNEVMDIESDDTAEEDVQGETPMRYEHIDQDMEELRRQEDLPEEQRDSGFAKLREHVGSYHEAIEAALKNIQERRREALRERGMDALMEMVKTDRIELVCTEHYIHTYNSWQWYTCTYKPKASGTPNQRVWGDIQDMTLNASPEAIAAVKATFDILDRQLVNSSRGGNS